MKKEILIPVQNISSIKDAIKELNMAKDSYCIITNQYIGKNKVNKSKNITMYSYNEKGVSRNRNRLIQNMSANIELMADDDISYVDNYEEIIDKAYKENPDADVIIFNFKRGDEVIGYNKKLKHNKITLLKIYSFQITFKRKSIEKANIFFDEDFGLNGNLYTSGEENIFLHDCLKNKLKIIHVPVVLCTHPDELTTGEKWTDKEIITKGAFCARVFKFGFRYKYYMVFFKHKYYKDKYTIFEFIRLFNKGKREYKKVIKNRRKKQPKI